MQEVVLNLLPNGVPPVCYISQYDGTSRVIRFHLLNGTEPLTLNGSETITLNFRKPDREEVTLSIENTSSNYIDLVISSELSDKHGEGFGEFRIQGLGTLGFKMYIESDAYGDSLKTRSVSGPIATFETDLAEDLIKLDVDLEPIQDLHGYDNPWPAGGGVNKLSTNRTLGTLSGNLPSTPRAFEYNKFYVGLSCNNYYAPNNITEYSVDEHTISLKTRFNAYGIAFPIKVTENTSYAINASSYNNTTAKLSIGYFDADGVHISYKQNIGALNVITTPANCVTAVVIVYDGGASDTVVSVTDIFFNNPSTVTTFTPYSNICPISGHGSAKLVRTGKNLIDTAKSLQQSSNVVVIGQNSAYSSHELFLKKGTYTIRVNTSVVASVYYHDGTSVRVGATNTNLTFTLSKDTWISFYIYTSAGISVSNITDYQLELGSEMTDYEPYSSDPTPITVYFGQTVYKGKLYSEQRKVLVTHGYEPDMGNYNYTYVSSNNCFRTTNFSKTYKRTSYSVIADSLCSQYSGDTLQRVLGQSAGNCTYAFGIVGLYNGSILFRNTNYSDAAEFKASMQNVALTYELEEPFYIDLSQEQTEDVEKAAVASFETNIQRPLETSEHYFSCSQAEGTPTPDDPIPITGVSEITAYRSGKNLANIEISAINHWGTDTPELVSLLNSLPVGTYTISNKYKVNELPGNNKVQHGRFYLTAMIGGTQTPVLSYSVVTDTSPAVGKIYEESGTFEITASNKGKFNHAYRYCDQDTTHTGNDRGSYICYDIQLELGSTATPYEPYSGESITVSFGGTYYGGKLVQKEDGSRKLVLTHGLISKAIADMNNSDTYPGWRNSGIKDMVGAGIDGSETGMLNIGTNYAFNTKGTNDILYLPRGSYNNLTQPQWIENYPDLVVQIRVPLAEPIEVSLPDGDPLTTLAGENNVYCNTGDTALTYYFNMVADPIRIPALVGTNNVYSDAGDVNVEYYTTLEGGND